MWWYHRVMLTRGDVLRTEMQKSGMTQRRLSRITGVSQGRISTYISNQQSLSDEMLQHLLSPLGVELHHRWETTPIRHTRHERLSWRFHLRLSELLTQQSFSSWKPKLLSNVDKQHRNSGGTENHGLIEQWRRMIEQDDIPGLRRVMTDPTPEGVRMRELTPFVGLLPQQDRTEILAEAS